MRLSDKYIFIIAFALIALSACQRVELPAPVEDGGIVPGEKVLFTTMLPDVAASTRSTKDEWTTVVNSYKPVNHNYSFEISMYKKDVATAIGTSTYRPERTTDIGAAAIEGYDGTLSHTGASPLLWQDNVSEWGFEAVANNNELSADQSTQEKWLAMDYLTGHSYLPLWDEETGQGSDPETIMYKTSKQWYADNKTAKDLSGLMVSSNDHYKKIPLYMKHERAWITIILKAGEGVRREALAFATAQNNISMTVNSYAPGQADAFPVTNAWASEYLIDYEKDKNGPAESRISTTRYDAIVMPHNYATNKESELIAKINLSNQNFSFYAANDQRYVNGTEEQVSAADEAYDLKAGKHLTITATLSRESRKILITAWIEDWTEVATNTICDDYGQNGDPTVIKNKQELIDYLVDTKKNSQGNVAIIQPTELNLDAGEPWSSAYELNSTLNLAGCRLTTGNQLFTKMTSSANLVNGTVVVSEGATVKYAIADSNEGMIERVNIVTKDENTTAKATVAGLVGLNTGTIYQCSSTLPVSADAPTTITGPDGTTSYMGYIGGIAAVSVSKDGTSMAVIDGCEVNAPVDGISADENHPVKGGGIAGIATGRVSSNVYEYGITLKQNPLYFKNIFSEAGTTDLRAYGNAWPTTAKNPVGNSEETNPNNYTGECFDAVIDSQEQLHNLMQNEYNITGHKYRISRSFTVTATNDENNWTHGTVKADDHEAGVNNVSFNLDGNGKTITLTGTRTVKTTTGKNLSEGDATEYVTAPMLFNYVFGQIRDLTIYLETSLVALPSEKENTVGEVTQTVYTAEDAIAPLAYAVYGENARLTNVKVKAHKDADGENDVFVQASTPAGLVVWAYGGATITRCKVQVPVRMWLPESMGETSKHYAGGIVAVAAKASISECTYLGNKENSVSGAATSTSAIKSPNYFYGGIVGGTSYKGEESPSLLIADCTSWFIATRETAESEDKSAKGAIIAYPCYADKDSGGSIITNGMDPDRKSEGNWWPLSAIGAHDWASGLSEELVIGKRNAINPTYDANF